MPRARLTLTIALMSALAAGQAWGQPVGGGNPADDIPPAAGTSSANLPAAGGSDAIARLLEALRPNVDTSIPPTASQITDRIEALLNAGQNEQALAEIQARLRQEENRIAPGTDVQLQFQHARALAALGRTGQAQAIYTEMTTRYPELPEPWNNLAALYVQQGHLDRAEQALQMALVANPRYATARANLADVQLMQAQRNYESAAAGGVAGTRGKASTLRNLIEGKAQP
ncbi:tetratricopeptide repeat protein [Orrella sp. JC864]|uniref:tetratricopeptide repeat protein n=1 Tax=Orrella sp. JC864 TaxID=3120298 RepID=UPI00300AD68C